MSLLDSSDPGVVNEKIRYWVDLWEDLISNFNKQLYGLDLVNPQLIIREIIDEIKSNHFQNKEIKGYFREKLDDLKRDPVLKEQSSSDFILFRKEFDTGSNSYLLELADAVMDLFQNGRYFDAAYNHLKAILQNPGSQADDDQNILTLSQHLIVELLLKGYSLDSIQSLPRNLFDTYTEKGGRIIMNYPIETNRRDFLDGDTLDVARFNLEVKAEIDSLDVTKRLDRFPSYYRASPTEGYFIFRIEGLKGETDFQLGDVNFYSPKSKKYITNEQFFQNAEYFGTDDERDFINAAVRVSFVDIRAAELAAAQTVEKALDVIRCYLPIQATLETRTEDYIIVDSEGKDIGHKRSVSERHESYRWRNSFDLSKLPVERIADGNLMRLFESVSGFLFSPLEDQSEIEQKIGYSLHWYRKAEEASKIEDRLLSYWIVIENILNLKPSSANALLPTSAKETPYSLAKALIPRLHVSNFVYEVGHQLYWYLRGLLSSGELTLPPGLIQACELDIPRDGEIDLSIRALVSQLPALTQVVGRKITIDKCTLADRFYHDNVFAKTELIKQMKKIEQDVLLVYRYRNRIVHNARFDATVLPYLVQKARTFAEMVLKRVVYERSTNATVTVEQVVVGDYARVNRILDRLERGVPIDFLNLGF